MFKKRSLIWIFLGLFLAQGFFEPVHAIDRETLQIAEFVTAFLRGTCSKVEYDLRQDDSARAHFKRMLISLTRCTHEMLLVKNHNDYHNYNVALAGADATKVLYDFGLFVHAAAKRKDANQQAASKDDQALVDSANELLLKNGNLKDVIKNADVISRTLLPEFERVLAMVLALVDYNTKEIKVVRFAASGMLSLTRLTQKYLNAGVDSKLRTLWGLLLVVSFSHFIYQLQGSSFFYRRTDFANWLNQNFPAPAPQPGPVPVAAGPQVVPHNPAGYPNVVVDEQAVGGVQIGVGGLGANDQCGICLAGWRQQPVHIGIAPCRHAYHLRCLQNAMAAGHQNCPECRQRWYRIMDYELQPREA